MTDQLALTELETVSNPEPKLREGNQSRAFEYIRAHDGVTAEQIGAHLHATRDERPHPVTDPCKWCEKSGRQTAESKGLKPFVTYTMGSGERLYLARRAEDRIAADPEPIVEPTEAELAANPFAGL